VILDFGSKAGSNIKRTQFGTLGEGKVISVDIRKQFLRLAPGKRVQADITKPIVKPKSVECVTMIHVLEHLNTIEDVRKTVTNAVEAAKRFVYIRGPWFDADEYLREKGFNLFWSTWDTHKTHLTKAQLKNIIEKINVKSFTVAGIGQPIHDSASHRVHPVGYEAGGNYVDGKYPPKELVKFDITIYDELCGTIEL